MLIRKLLRPSKKSSAWAFANNKSNFVVEFFQSKKHFSHESREFDMPMFPYDTNVPDGCEAVRVIDLGLLSSARTSELEPTAMVMIFYRALGTNVMHIMFALADRATGLADSVVDYSLPELLSRADLLAMVALFIGMTPEEALEVIATFMPPETKDSFVAQASASIRALATYGREADLAATLLLIRSRKEDAIDDNGFELAAWLRSLERQIMACFAAVKSYVQVRP
jgi:hypothetical protein